MNAEITLKIKTLKNKWDDKKNKNITKNSSQQVPIAEILYPLFILGLGFLI